MDRTIVTNATCTSCGCLCDDIDLHTEDGRIVRAERACRLGREWFFGYHGDSHITALVDGRPRTLTLKQMLEEFLRHRKEVIRRRTEFQLREAKTATGGQFQSDGRLLVLKLREPDAADSATPR